MDEIKKLMVQFEKKHFQGYVHVTFCTSSFTWGIVRFRTEMSGAPTGEFRFTSQMITRPIILNYQLIRKEEN